MDGILLTTRMSICACRWADATGLRSLSHTSVAKPWLNRRPRLILDKSAAGWQVVDPTGPALVELRRRDVDVVNWLRKRVGDYRLGSDNAEGEESDFGKLHLCSLL